MAKRKLTETQKAWVVAHTARKKVKQLKDTLRSARDMLWHLEGSVPECYNGDIQQTLEECDAALKCRRK